MQGLNTTSVHGHTALFGVYGMLGIGLMLFCLKGLAACHVWKTRVPGFPLWTIDVGLALMGLAEPLAGGPDSNPGQRRARHVVCTFS